jgi:hypothetical protein
MIAASSQELAGGVDQLAEVSLIFRTDTLSHQFLDEL